MYSSFSFNFSPYMVIRFSPVDNVQLLVKTSLSFISIVMHTIAHSHKVTNALNVYIAYFGMMKGLKK
jgi:hypothetical protein